jgi:hypothetical protein
MATIDEFVLKKYIIIERIFESEIILIPPSLKISESSSNGSYRNTDKVWWRYDEGTESAEVATSARFGPKYISTQKISTLFDALDEREIAR